MGTEHLKPRFVEAIPEQLEPGYLYVSIRFRTAQHLCACGCGSLTVTPIKPAKYSLTYNGETVSLWPSVGNWQKPCKSHYVVRDGRIEWYPEWTEDQIATGRARDAAELRSYFESKSDSERSSDGERTAPATRRGRVALWIRSLFK